MSSFSWSEIMNKYRNSVIQLICTIAKYDAIRPYKSPDDRKVYGSGFIINNKNGLLLTNAHVVSNAIHITGRLPDLGEKDLPVKLISICREKDIALCQLQFKINALDMPFGDSLLVNETDQVATLGYPLGQKNIKITTGIISGFESEEEDETSFIQVTAPINPGNSGGPLLNDKGEVIGINSAGYNNAQNVGYAIGTRIILAILSELITPLTKNLSTPYILKTPRYAFEFNRTNASMLELICGRESEGIYIKRIYPDSPFKDLKVGDIMTGLSYSNIDAKIDSYGDCSLTSIKRKISIKELFDMIPIGSNVTINTCKNSFTALFSVVPSTIRCKIYPHFTPFKYMIIAGLCIGELTVNHINELIDLDEYNKGYKKYKRKLIVNQVFPNTIASQVQVFKTSTIIKSVNDVEVSTIEELKSAISLRNDYIVIISEDDDRLILTYEEAAKDDKHSIELFNISTKN